MLDGPYYASSRDHQSILPAIIVAWLVLALLGYAIISVGRPAPAATQEVTTHE